MVNKVSDAIRYIGVDDLELDLFESQYIVPEGMAYNSYLILDEKTAVMDTVDSHKTEEFLKNLKEELNGRSLDYIVVQHLEPDHSGSLAATVKAYPDAKIVSNAKTFAMIPQFMEIDLPEEKTVVVKEGDTLSLGSHTLQFILTPMIHWPEVMMTYESSEKVFFSADAFGKFGAICKEDENEEGWACEARRYYFGIVGKYGMPVQNLLKKAASLDIEKICPLHGPVLDSDLEYYINTYNTWSSYQPEDKGVFIAYASIHGNTAVAAKRLAEILTAMGEKVAISDLCREDMAECVEDAFRYDRMVLCASSYDGGVFLPMHDFLTHLSYKTYQNRAVAFVENGSWGPTAARTMKSLVEPMKNITIIDPVVTIKSSMKEADVSKLEELAMAVVAAAR